MFQKIIKFSICALVFLMPLFFLPFSFEAFEFNKGYLLFFLVTIGLLAWLGKMVFKDKRVSFRRTPLDLFVLGYLAVMILNVIFSQDRITSLLGLYGRFWPSLVGTLSLGGFYFLLTNNVSPLINADKKPINADKKIGINQPESVSISGLIKAFFWSSSLVVLITYFSLFGFWTKISNYLVSINSKLVLPQVMLFQGFNAIGNSIEALTVFLAVVAIFLVTLLAFKGLKGIAIYVLLFAILGLLLIVDFWPAWLIISLTLLLFLVFSFKKRIFREDVNRLSLPIFLLLISLIFFFFNPLQNLLPQDSVIGNLPIEILPSQKVSWSIGWEGLKENPFLGAGLGNFSYLFSKFKPQTFLETPFWQIRFDRPINHMAEILGTTGVIGILSYLLLIGMFLLVSWIAINSKSQALVPNFQFPVLLAFLALLAGQFFYYQNTVLAFSFWLFLGLGTISWGGAVKGKSFGFRDFPELGLVFTIIFWVVLFGFLFSYFIMGKFYLADVYYRQYLINPTKWELSLEGNSPLEKATRIADSRTVYHIVLARGYLQKLSEEAVKPQPDNQVLANMVALAVREGKRAVELSPNMVSAQETLGFVYRDIRGIAEGATDWGIKVFEKAIGLEPKNPILLTELAKLYIVNNNLEKAKELFNRALEMRSDYAEAAISLSILEESEGKTEEAIKRLENLINENPYSVEAHFQLGRLYYNQNEHDKAIQQFQIAIQLFPNHSNSLYSLGLVYERKGDKEKALEFFRKVLELNPESGEVKDKIRELLKEESEE